MTATKHKDTFPTATVFQVAGEDIRPGDFIAVSCEVVELPSFLWSCSGVVLPAEEPIRVRYLPADAGLPFKVAAVCLPFVYAQRPQGKLTTFDIRQRRLVRLDKKVGRAVWKRLRDSG